MVVTEKPCFFGLFRVGCGAKRATRSFETRLPPAIPDGMAHNKDLTCALSVGQNYLSMSSCAAEVTSHIANDFPSTRLFNRFHRL
jgi:hypothetical protein